MFWGLTAIIIGLTAFSFVSSLPSIEVIKAQQRSNDVLDILKADQGTVAGRVVAIPAQLYRKTFKDTLKLGQCPLVMTPSKIQTCSDKFTGDTIFLAKGSTTVDVSRVQSSEDILLHIMGGVGASVGVLGLVSASVKINVAVTTETSRQTLNLMSSYDVSRGILTLHNPRPVQVSGEKALFLSEIELGGTETFLVTLKFETEKQKVDVQYTVTFKVLFISISAKLRFVHTTMKTNAEVTIQFLSSWRAQKDEYFDSLAQAIPRVEELEKMYMQGPKEIREMDIDNEKLHNFYYFSSWKQSPYEAGLSMALVNHDLEFLTEQNTEVQSVLQRIRDARTYGDTDKRNRLLQLNATLTGITENLNTGIKNYHQLSPSDREELRNVYGWDKAPLYYQRQFDKIMA